MLKKTAEESNQIFPGWLAIIGGLVAVVCHGTTSYAGSYILSIMILDEGLHSTTAGYCASIISLCSVLFATPLGVIFSKRGHRFGLLLGVLSAAVGFAVLALMPASDILVIIMYFFLGLAIVVSCKVGVPSLVNRWFQHTREFPVSLVLAGGSMGGVFTGLISGVMSQSGWRGGWVFMFVFNLITLAAILLLVRDNVHELGEVRDGRRWREKHGYTMDDSDAPVQRTGSKGYSDKKPENGSLMTNPRFILFSIACLFRMGIYAGCVGYVTLIIVSKGYAREEAVLAVGSLAVASMVGRLTGPIWIRVLRLSNLNTNRIAHIIAGVGGLIVFFSDSLTMLGFSITLIGFAYGVGYVAQTLVLSDLFPNAEYSTVFGTFTTIVNFSFLFPSIIGLLGAAIGDYSPIYLVFGLINFAFALLLSLCKQKHDGTVSVNT